MRISHLAAGAAMAAALAACGDGAGPGGGKGGAQGGAIDPAAVQAVTEAAQADANAVPVLIQQLLISLKDAGEARASQLAITLGGQSVAVDVWLWDRGLIDVHGAEAGEPVFSLTAAGLALVEAPPPWLRLQAAGPAAGDCHRDARILVRTCSIRQAYGVVPSATGQAALGGQAPARLEASGAASRSTKGWRAALSKSDQAPHVRVLDAILGPPSGRAAARAAYDRAVVAKLQAATLTDAPLAPRNTGL